MLVKFGIWCMVVNMVFNFILVILFGYVGFVVVISMLVMFNVVLFYIMLYK